MQKHEKPLPPPPRRSCDTTAKLPLHSNKLPAEQQHSSLKEQNTELKRQNENLRHVLQKKNEEIAQLQQKIAEYQSYVKQQYENFTRVSRKVCSVFEEYQSTVENIGVGAIEVDPVDEAIQAYAAFSDSDEDFI